MKNKLMIFLASLCFLLTEIDLYSGYSILKINKQINLFCIADYMVKIGNVFCMMICVVISIFVGNIIMLNKYNNTTVITKYGKRTNIFWKQVMSCGIWSVVISMIYMVSSVVFAVFIKIDKVLNWSSYESFFAIQEAKVVYNTFLEIVSVYFFHILFLCWMISIVMILVWWINRKQEFSIIGIFLVLFLVSKFQSGNELWLEHNRRYEEVAIRLFLLIAGIMITYKISKKKDIL